MSDVIVKFHYCCSLHGVTLFVLDAKTHQPVMALPLASKELTFLRDSLVKAETSMRMEVN